MSRTERLLSLIQTLRSHRYPVSGAALADATGISMRTLYRDIAELRAQGAVIDGEPGVGYVLQPGFLLPPLMFTSEEIDALALGAKWVALQGDGGLSSAIESALAKIATVLPEDRDTEPANTALFAFTENPQVDAHITVPIRKALRHQKKLFLHYTDGNQAKTERKVWPVALGYFDHVQLLLAWCELRSEFRRFRVDRIVRVTALDERLPRPRQALLREWLATSI
ncbi:MAG: YafY family protein [Parasphingorhabdus sp.]|uniref:helix-turn-helix transcriptional regulator n=1 Tax=Parasphingorhabdus sp. TaxID=2709688 RepID=UPI0032981BAA